MTKHVECARFIPLENKANVIIMIKIYSTKLNHFFDINNVDFNFLTG